MQICTSPQMDNHASIPGVILLKFSWDGSHLHIPPHWKTGHPLSVLYSSFDCQSPTEPPYFLLTILGTASVKGTLLPSGAAGDFCEIWGTGTDYELENKWSRTYSEVTDILLYLYKVKSSINVENENRIGKTNYSIVRGKLLLADNIVLINVECPLPIVI